MTAGRKNGASTGKRRLTKEELSLWLQVTRTITPRPGVQAVDLPPEAPSKTEAVKAEEPLAVSEALKPGKGPFRTPQLPLAPIERRLRQRLSRGQTAIDLKIDLHGMRQDEAHSALRGFLARARQCDAKVVLVVTGKGANKVRQESGYGYEGGVLRRIVPHWLSAPDLRHVVLGFEEAAQGHGGSGALYVRLRSKRPAGGPYA